MKKLMVTLMAFGTFFQVMAQTTTTTEATNTSETNASDVMQSLVQSPWGLRMDTESFSQRNDQTQKIDYVKTNLYPTLSYSVTTNDVLHFYPQIIMTKSTEPGNNGYDFLDDFIAFRYDKMKILTEANNGIDFSLSSRYYTLASDEARYRTGSYGLINPRLYFTKKFNEQFTVTSENRFYFYQTNGTYSKANSKDYKHIIYLTPIYQLSSNLSSYVELRQITEHGRRVYSNDELRIKPGVDYKVSDSLTLGLSFMNYPVEGRNYKNSVIENELSAIYSLNKNVQANFYVTSQVADTETNDKSLRQRFNDSVEVEVDLLLKAF